MTKLQDLEKKVTELSKDVEKLKETIIPIWNSIEEWDVIYSDYCKEWEDILVPENIHIEMRSWWWDGLWISFNDNKQVLYYYNWIWMVWRWDPNDIVQCKLIKCNREDLKSWDTAYMSNVGIKDIGEMWCYWKILNDEEYASIFCKGIAIGNSTRKDRYKVVEA